MIVCKSCGFRNTAADSFCGSCGAFLEWTGEKVEAPKPAPALTPEPEPEQKRGLLSRVQSLLYADVGSRDPIPRATTGPGAMGGGMRPPGSPPSMAPPGPPGAPGSKPPGAFGGGMKPMGAPPTGPPGTAARPGPPPPPGGAGRPAFPPPPPPGARPAVPPPPPPGGAGRPAGSPPSPPGGARSPAGPPPPPPPAAGGTRPVPPPPPAGGAPAGTAPTADAGAKLLAPPTAGGPPPPPSGNPFRSGNPTLSGGPPVPPQRTTTPASAAGAPPVPAQRTGSAEALVSPVQRGSRTEAEPEPQVVAPQERGPARRSVVRSEPTRRLQPGDLICGDCGEGNLPTRSFCSRCGTSLKDAESVKAKWWRRLLPRRKPRKAEPVSADVANGAAATGQRRQHKRAIFPLIRRTVAVVILVVGLLYATVPAVRTWINPKVVAGRQWVEHKVFTQYAPVRAVKATATPVDKKHPAIAAVDGFTNTYWSTPVTGTRRIVLQFQEPVELKKALIRGGIVGELRGSQRPRTLHLVYPTGKTQDLKMQDHTDPQEFELDSGGKVKTVEVYVQDTYDNATSKVVTVTEIELFVHE